MIGGARRGAAAALTIALAGAVASGCGAPRSGAVAETGPCAQVLPLAQAHVPKQARLVAVQALKRGQLRPLLQALDKQVPGARPRPERKHPQHTGLGVRVPRKGCVLVYRGSFRPHGVITGSAAGRYLVLVIGVRHVHLLRGVVVDRLPPVIAKAA